MYVFCPVSLCPHSINLTILLPPLHRSIKDIAFTLSSTSILFALHFSIIFWYSHTKTLTETHITHSSSFSHTYAHTLTQTYACIHIDNNTHLLTHSLTHSLTNSLTHSLTHSHVYSDASSCVEDLRCDLGTISVCREFLVQPGKDKIRCESIKSADLLWQQFQYFGDIDAQR